MGTTTVDVNLNKYYPEKLIATYSNASLPTGTTDMIDIKNINPDNQIVTLDSWSVDAVSSIDTLLKTKSAKLGALRTTDTIASFSTVGIAADNECYGGHPIKYVPRELILSASNRSGATSANYRSRVNFTVNNLDTLTKKKLGLPLNSRDNEAWDILTRKANTLAAQPHVFDMLGSNIPPNFTDFQVTHEVIECRPYSLPDSTTITSTNTYLINDQPKYIGKSALVLEKIYIQRPAQTSVGVVTVNIYRDNQPTTVCTFDPACLPDIAKPNAETVVNGLPFINLHIHAFELLQITITATSNQNNYKAFAYASERPIGLSFKARMHEFLHGGDLPLALQYTDEEAKFVKDTNLQEMFRVGIPSVAAG